MANRIKGLTVEIDGSTTGLDKALKDVNSTIKNTQTQLKDVQRLLKLDPSNTELLSQKQRLLKDAIGETKEKLETLKTAQEQAKKQLEEGTLGQDKYDALQREIEETEQSLKNLESQVSTTYAALEKIDQTGKKFQKRKPPQDPIIKRCHVFLSAFHRIPPVTIALHRAAVRKVLSLLLKHLCEKFRSDPVISPHLPLGRGFFLY